MTNGASEEDIYSRQGFGHSLGIQGQVGFLMVDFVNGFSDPAVFGGGNIASAIEQTHDVLMLARNRRWPVAHSRIVYADNGADANVFSAKVPGMLTLTENASISAIVPSLAPISGECIVRKTAPSAFFGTGLAPWLTMHRVETLLIAGCTTSGCVRASVVDAMCHGFRPVVIADCVGDRAMGPHQASLFDIAQKYGDVVRRASILAL
ncbi:isochorismatase family protein [Pseudorhodoplanes sinuspersici]|uniref:N-carbamoylsarcosine amidase n=1 Tax=Pseudorhodoplanes sinuspersici TaxID=1235591 RepID=A0A1W6ZQZ7_9HYPH|nr:isochorismatase family protein [Pseudorhodoplanes sinuspersici]ARP99791.1 N-carbamoylsarcosine amidase [Pseudorhodoplanes sinuspersici]RKE70791.1 maleamate amidohydrolase [Pseudorhodoplanes sinuspersici]